MFWVTESGENIGTIRNIFREIDQAIEFVERTIAFSGRQYQKINDRLWRCCDADVYLTIENAS